MFKSPLSKPIWVIYGIHIGHDMGPSWVSPYGSHKTWHPKFIWVPHGIAQITHMGFKWAHKTWVKYGSPHSGLSNGFPGPMCVTGVWTDHGPLDMNFKWDSSGAHLPLWHIGIVCLCGTLEEYWPRRKGLTRDLAWPMCMNRMWVLPLQVKRNRFYMMPKC